MELDPDSLPEDTPTTPTRRRRFGAALTEFLVTTDLTAMTPGGPIVPDKIRDQAIFDNLTLPLIKGGEEKL